MIFSACTALTVEILKINTHLALSESVLSPMASHILVLTGYIMVLRRIVLGTMGYDLGYISRQHSLKHLARSIACLVLYRSESQTGDMRLSEIHWLAKTSALGPCSSLLEHLRNE